MRGKRRLPEEEDMECFHVSARNRPSDVDPGCGGSVFMIAVRPWGFERTRDGCGATRVPQWAPVPITGNAGPRSGRQGGLT